MAKITGLGLTNLNVDDSAGSPQDIKNDVTNFQFATPRGVQDVTGVDKSAMERLLLLADFSMSLNGVFNASSDQSHDVFKDVGDPSADANRSVNIVHSGQEMDAEVIFTDYAITRAANGALTFTAPAVLADGTAPAWSTT